MVEYRGVVVGGVVFSSILRLSDEVKQASESRFELRRQKSESTKTQQRCNFMFQKNDFCQRTKILSAVVAADLKKKRRHDVSRAKDVLGTSLKTGWDERRRQRVV